VDSAGNLSNGVRRAGDWIDAEAMRKPDAWVAMPERLSRDAHNTTRNATCRWIARQIRTGVV